MTVGASRTTDARTPRDANEMPRFSDSTRGFHEITLHEREVVLEREVNDAIGRPRGVPETIRVVQIATPDRTARFRLLLIVAGYFNRTVTRVMVSAGKSMSKQPSFFFLTVALPVTPSIGELADQRTNEADSISWFPISVRWFGCPAP